VLSARARLIGLTPGRVSHLRWEFEAAWKRFTAA
jgi:hypothetical protein